MPTILDSTWQRHDGFDRARSAAARLGAELIEVECRIAPDTARERIRRRTAEDPSDATPDLVDQWQHGHDAWDEAIYADATIESDALAARILTESGLTKM